MMPGFAFLFEEFHFREKSSLYEGATTFSTATLSIMTINIMTLGIKVFLARLSINYTQHYSIMHQEPLCSVAIYVLFC